MSNEVRVTSGLQIRNGNLQYLSQPQTVQANMTGNIGPTPGAIQVSTSGTDVNLSQLTAPGGWCRIMYIGDALGTGSAFGDFITYGPKSGGVLIPLGDLLPGEQAVLRLSKNLTTLRIQAGSATADVLVEAFDK